jgi:hypothetical protein
METKETGERSFVQYLMPDGTLAIDYQTLLTVTGIKNKTELFRHLKKMGPEVFPFSWYRNRKLFPTANSIRFWQIFISNERS